MSDDAVAESDDEASLRLDPDEIARGRQQIEQIRARLGSKPRPTEARTPPVTPQPDEPFAPDRMAAQMASAAEREALEQRVAQLEAEVRSLRNALARILSAAADAVGDPSNVEG